MRNQKPGWWSRFNLSANLLICHMLIDMFTGATKACINSAPRSVYSLGVGKPMLEGSSLGRRYRRRIWTSPPLHRSVGAGGRATGRCARIAGASRSVRRCPGTRPQQPGTRWALGYDSCLVFGTLAGGFSRQRRAFRGYAHPAARAVCLVASARVDVGCPDHRPCRRLAGSLARRTAASTALVRIRRAVHRSLRDVGRPIPRLSADRDVRRIPGGVPQVAWHDGPG